MGGQMRYGTAENQESLVVLVRGLASELSLKRLKCHIPAKIMEVGDLRVPPGMAERAHAGARGVYVYG